LRSNENVVLKKEQRETGEAANANIGQPSTKKDLNEKERTKAF